MAYPRVLSKRDGTAVGNLVAVYARSARWKYTLYVSAVRYTKGQTEWMRIAAMNAPPLERERWDEDLFDLEADPYEQVDLADAPGVDAIKKELREAVLRWWEETGGEPIPLHRKFEDG